MPPTIVYITSLGHSGSTLLDLLIAAHPRVFTVGEVINLRAYAHMTKTANERSKFGNECTCAAPTIWQCAFWTRVEAVLKERHAMSLKDMDLRTDDQARFARENAALFDAIAHASGRDIIVDSSKAPTRLASLVKAGFARIVPIHLVRGSRGMVYSQMKRGEPLLKMCLHFTRRTLQIKSTLRGLDHAMVKYERLVEDPAAQVKPLMERIGLEFLPEQLQWAGREHHNLGGNSMRRSTDSTIRLDTAWQKGLTPMQRRAIDLLTWPANAATRG